MPDEPLLRLHSLAYPVTALGPGRRLALWVAGCRRRCQGCITPTLQSPESGLPVASAVLARRVLHLAAERPGALDGLTLTGGEPFDQASALVALMDRVMPHYPQWTVIAYSGDSLAALRRRSLACRALLARIDLLIDGPFRARQSARHPLAGSGNQRLWGLTGRGQILAKTSTIAASDQANLGLTAHGQDWLIGILPPPARTAWHERFSNVLPVLDPVS
ncbi:MAG: 4Fe-4S single cluster domain-containing protein [Pseudomonadota bacterium]